MGSVPPEKQTCFSTSAHSTMVGVSRLRRVGDTSTSLAPSSCMSPFLSLISFSFACSPSLQRRNRLREAEGPGHQAGSPLSWGSPLPVPHPLHRTTLQQWGSLGNLPGEYAPLVRDRNNGPLQGAAGLAGRLPAVNILPWEESPTEPLPPILFLGCPMN